MCVPTHIYDDLEGDQEKITSRKRQSEMEKYCPKQGQPERGVIVFVAESSQV